MEKFFQWLVGAVLKDSTESLIMAAQEWALNPRAIEAQDPRCRLCKEAPEIVDNITAVYKML